MPQLPEPLPLFEAFTFPWTVVLLSSLQFYGTHKTRHGFMSLPGLKFPGLKVLGLVVFSFASIAPKS